MKQTHGKHLPQPDRWSYLWLGLGAVLLMLSFGSFGIAFAAWAAPIFLLRFFRARRAGKGFVLILLGIFIAQAISWRIILASFFTLPIYLIFVLGVSVQYSLPYLADRLLAHRIKGFWSTLIFPFAMTAIYFLNNLVSPMGSWGTPGYEQYHNLTLIQLVSVTGLWGLTWLVSWLGPVVNWAWERSFSWPEIRRGVMIWAGVVALVLLFGGLRLSFSKSQPGLVQVHGLNVKTDWDSKVSVIASISSSSTP